MQKIAIKYLGPVKELEMDLEDPQNFKMYPGKGVSADVSYGTVYAGNAKFLAENDIDFAFLIVYNCRVCFV